MAIHNFNAGPGILPSEVFQQASEAILNFQGSGLSLLEIGHRTPLFQPVMEEARALVRELMQLDADQEVLFLHGGATTQFMQVPMNLLDPDDLAAYTETGAWAAKAVKEAKRFGHVEIAASGQEGNFTRIPTELDYSPTAKYLHITTNETIGGIQWKNMPFHDEVPLVADMSSDILSRRLAFHRFGLIYAGAQKNLGAAGVNLVVVNKNILGKISRDIPMILDYRQHIKEASMLNTPPVFAVYVVLLNLRWVKSQGGVEEMEKRNLEKARLFYDTVEQLPLFTLPIPAGDRSRTNAVFLMADKKLEKEFLEAAAREGMVGIRGHRSVGGFRISLYNALPLHSVKALTDFMISFANKKG